MTDEISGRAHHDVDKVDAHAMHGYGYGYLLPWMAHWNHTNYMSTINPGWSGEVRSDHSMDVTGAAMIGFGSEPSLVSGGVSEKLKGRLPFQRQEKSVFRKEDGKLGIESCSGDDKVSVSRVRPLPSAPHKIETSIEKCQLLSQRVPIGSLRDNEPKNLTLFAPVKSASDIVLTNVRDKGKSAMNEVTGGPREVYPSSYSSASQEHYTNTKFHSYSVPHVPEKQMSSSLLDHQRFSLTRLMRGSFTHFPHDPIADSDDDGHNVVRSQHHKIQNLIVNPNIANQTSLLESAKPQNFYSSVEQVPQSVYGVKDASKYTNVDSVEKLSRGLPNISQATHRFLVSKIPGVNLSNKGQFFRESMPHTKFKGNNFNEILDLSLNPPASDHTKLETLGSSVKSEGKENVSDFKRPTSLTNESTPEPDFMDIGTSHENNLPGEAPMLSNKCSKDSQNSLSTLGATTSARGKNLEKPGNINEQELLTRASPIVDMETSTSRTRSLDVDQLFSQEKEPARSKSSHSSLGSDPSSRWVKRLKLCSPEHALGTKSENIGETSHVKLTNMKDAKTNLEAETVYNDDGHAEGQTVLEPPLVLSNAESSFTEAKEAVEITLSHPWIQRWSHNRAACSKKRHKTVENHDPKSSNSTAGEVKNKPFPSVAAMALLGKAMNSLNPSQLTKKGPVIVWNMKGL
ncbi:uncharacterized protein LOC131632261 isoform X1 [Vicia villosa]|uniref:uncharacterized protein LOC131632261 isoform X1 n=1 Tax=Vicia villosa TaxID=3911 RepID=UPI00273BA26A|nr:uncharacterized protein LOC131632261 isoform X1 [Vicia villosa]